MEGPSETRHSSFSVYSGKLAVKCPVTHVKIRSVRARKVANSVSQAESLREEYHISILHKRRGQTKFGSVDLLFIRGAFISEERYLASEETYILGKKKPWGTQDVIGFASTIILDELAKKI